jgi:hypothetical protein
LHPEKLHPPETISPDGMSIDLNPLSRNADSSIRSNREPLSNVIDSSDLHLEKLHLPKTTTEDGITIDFNPLSKNASSAITSVVEPFSKATTVTSNTTGEYNFTDRETQRSPPGVKSEADQRNPRTNPSSTVFSRLKELGTALDRSGPRMNLRQLLNNINLETATIR